MTTRESLAELQKIKSAAAKEASLAATLKRELNTSLASIVEDSREIDLRPNEISRVLSKLVKNTKHETYPQERQDNVLPEKEFLVSDVFEFGKAPFNYNVWFERPGRSGPVFLYFSRIVRDSY